jgi:hypothetical protein
MAAGLTRYEVRVATLLSRAALATFRVPVSTTTIPRNTVYRFRVFADDDPSELLDRLTGCDVEILELRRCPEPRRPNPGTADGRQDDPPPEPDGAPAVDDGVVLPFRGRGAPCLPGRDPDEGGSAG